MHPRAFVGSAQTIVDADQNPALSVEQGDLVSHLISFVSSDVPAAVNPRHHGRVVGMCRRVDAETEQVGVNACDGFIRDGGWEQYSGRCGRGLG